MNPGDHDNYECSCLPHDMEIRLAVSLINCQATGTGPGTGPGPGPGPGIGDWELGIGNWELGNGNWE